MPPIVLTEEQQAAALKRGSADLKFLFDRNEVPAEVAAKWYHSGVTTLEKFANIAKDVDDLVEVLKAHLDIDQSRTLEERVQVAAVSCAWTNARTRVQRAAEVEAELDTKEWRKPVTTSEWLAMRAGLEKVVGTLDERLTPAKEFIEKKLQEVESGDYRAEDLTEVVSREEVDPDSLVPQWDAKGNITVRRGTTRVKEPKNPEALRQRLTVLRNAFQMLSLRHTNRPELQGDYVKAFEDYKDYLMGEHVYGLNAKDAEGMTIAAPPFNLVLSYERAIRKEAARKMNQEGVAFPAALRAAWRDPLTKERHFTTPLALVAKRPNAPTSVGREVTWQQRSRASSPKGALEKELARPRCSRAAPRTTGKGLLFVIGLTPWEKSASRRSASLHINVASAFQRSMPCSSARCLQGSLLTQEGQPDLRSLCCCTSSPAGRGGIHWHGSSKSWRRSFHFVVEVIELDLRHSRKVDFTQPKVQSKWLRFIGRSGGRSCYHPALLHLQQGTVGK